LKVGPQSAGADPGPACYGQGGTEPTVTDANLIVGRIDPDYFLGSGIRLRRDQAAAAITERIARPLGMSLAEAALGILTIANFNMSLAVRAVSVEKGYDPRDCVLVPSGGGGALHAMAIARELSVPRVIIPPMPAHFSAFGMLLADLKHDYVQTFVRSERTGAQTPTCRSGKSPPTLREKARVEQILLRRFRHALSAEHASVITEICVRSAMRRHSVALRLPHQEHHGPRHPRT
jgi:N-methylhydantoinase A/oxoprolinase/acetone carboxylase beta subunit